MGSEVVHGGTMLFTEKKVKRFFNLFCLQQKQASPCYQHLYILIFADWTLRPTLSALQYIRELSHGTRRSETVLRSQSMPDKCHGFMHGSCPYIFHRKIESCTAEFFALFLLIEQHRLQQSTQHACASLLAF